MSYTNPEVVSVLLLTLSRNPLGMPHDSASSLFANLGMSTIVSHLPKEQTCCVFYVAIARLQSSDGVLSRKPDVHDLYDVVFGKCAA